MPKLTAKGIAKLPAGRHGDDDTPTLFLVVKPSGARSWVQRLVIGSQRCDFGLGSAAWRTLREAREMARENRRIARRGGDPLAERRKAKTPTFAQAAEQVIALHGASWRRGGKTATLWRATLSQYVYPHFGDTEIDKVTTADAMTALTPIWLSKHETARKVRRRIGTVMKWAVAQGHRQDNPAGEAITAAMPKRAVPVKHMTALPYADVADAIARVRASGAWAGTKLAFEFLVLTAARSGEVRHADWSEIDLERRVWTVPPEKMKAGRAHRVPLSGRAVAILLEAITLGPGHGLLFPSVRGGAISDMTLSKLVKEQGIACVPHGFRSSFRDWAAERTDHPREVIEAALAHVVGNQTEAAYARSDLFDRRRSLMDDWAAYLAS